MSENPTAAETDQQEQRSVGVDHMLPDFVRNVIIVLAILGTYGFFAGIWALFAKLAYDSSGTLGGAVFGVGAVIIALIGIKGVVPYVKGAVPFFR